MTRSIRCFVAGVPAHIVHRGVNRMGIFRCEGDYLFYRQCLEKTGGELGVAVHSYVLMTDHIHLLVTPPEKQSISKLMQSVAGRYVGYFNHRYGRTGPLWEGRYYATIIDSERYLIACHRYIDNNPVRAGMVSRPDLYPWSSHRTYVSGHADTLVTPHAVIAGMAPDAAARRIAYRGLFTPPDDADELRVLRSASRRCRPLSEILHPPSTVRPPGRPRKKIGV